MSWQLRKRESASCTLAGGHQAARVPAGPGVGKPAAGLAIPTGLRRVDWIRLRVGRDDAQLGAEAVGVGFRLPVTCPVPLSVARELIASGTPYVVRHANGGR
jgi:hypothetical protein